MNSLHAIYCHIPFCLHRCGYCDFNTYAGQMGLLPTYVKSLCDEIDTVASRSPEHFRIGSIFFGGGTPSLLSPKQLGTILERIHKNFCVEDAEISLEANPGTVTRDALHEMAQIGFNRISFGVQSFIPDELHLLERIHDAFAVFNAIAWARIAGFKNLNLDLIYGLPMQPIERWKTSLQQAVQLKPEHLSLYALSIEKGTPFGRWAAHGLMSSPDPDEAAGMYECATEFLEQQGYEQYEISNWSLPGNSCRHNLHIWRNFPYLGFGAGAHGYAGGVRYANVRRIKTYLERLSSPMQTGILPLSPAAASQFQMINIKTEMQETMLLGLRLTREGVNTETFRERFGITPQKAFPGRIEKLTRLKLLEWEGDTLHLSRQGRLLGNRVFSEFID